MTWGLDNRFKRIILIGSDIFYLDIKIIQSGFNTLSSHDVVLGPTYDGGYYLLGLKQIHERLFNNISWSTDVVLDQTLGACQTDELSVHLLPLLADIDCVEDFQHLKAEDKIIFEKILNKGM